MVMLECICGKITIYFDNNQILQQLMRLLLLKTHQNQRIPPQNLFKNLTQTITPVIQNILSKKCLVEDFKGPQRKIVFYSITESELTAYGFRITVEIAPQEGRAVYRSTLCRNCQAVMVGSEMRVNFMHKVNRRARGPQEHTVKIDSCGQIQLVKKLTYSALLFSSSSQLMRQVGVRVRALLHASLAALDGILLEINEGSRGAEQLKAEHGLHLEKVKRHIYFSCYDLGLSEKASEYRHPTEQTLKQREKIIKSLLGPEKQEEHFREGQLYGRQEVVSVPNSKEWRRQFQSTYYFEKLLQVPIPKVVAPGQNVFIFNQIKVERPQSVAAQDLPNGGGCLKVMALSAAYLGGQAGAQKQEKLQFLPKIVLAKSPKGDSVRQRGKVLHERNIVRLFSSAHSGYLLKYYACSQQNFAFRHSLLMDYHPGTSSLLQHLQIRRETLSVQGKLGLLAHLSNALRFLAYYKVVHMDLTLSNVLVYDGYLPKLIDFGEAYHRDTIDSTIKAAYQPGFTLPYCAPEVFKGKQFSSAQDMFSFGVVTFRVLLSFLPFFPSDSLVGVYKQKGYHSRFLLAPQGLASICQQQVCYLLLQLVNLCLRAEEDGRPLPIWSTIILKEILTEIFL